MGLVLGAEKLKPVSWRDWAGEIERDGGARNPYMGLEERYGFWDIRVREYFLFFPPLAVGLWLATAVFFFYGDPVEANLNGGLLREMNDRADHINAGKAEGICGLDAG